MTQAKVRIKQELEEVIMEKATQVAYCSLKKLHVTPFVKPDGRVAFRVRGNVSDVLAELQANPSVPLLDYLNRLETIRSFIFTLKKGNHAEVLEGQYG